MDWVIWMLVGAVAWMAWEVRALRRAAQGARPEAQPVRRVPRVRRS